MTISSSLSLLSSSLGLWTSTPTPQASITTTAMPHCAMLLSGTIPLSSPAMADMEGDDYEEEEAIYVESDGRKKCESTVRIVCPSPDPKTNRTTKKNSWYSSPNKEDRRFRRRRRSPKAVSPPPTATSPKLMQRIRPTQPRKVSVLAMGSWWEEEQQFPSSSTMASSCSSGSLLSSPVSVLLANRYYESRVGGGKDKRKEPAATTMTTTTRVDVAIWV